MKDKAAVRERIEKSQTNAHQPPAAQEEPGGSWQFIAVLVVIGIGVVGLVVKAFGIF